MYDPAVAYETDEIVAWVPWITSTNAFKSKEEASGMSCASGKVRLPACVPLLEPLYSLVMDLHMPIQLVVFENITVGLRWRPWELRK